MASQALDTLALNRAGIRLAEHVVHMPGHSLPKFVFCGEKHNSKRSQASNKKRFKNTFKASVKSLGKDPDTRQAAA